jgi:hypothetical protein
MANRTLLTIRYAAVQIAAPTTSQSSVWKRRSSGEPIH